MCVCVFFVLFFDWIFSAMEAQLCDRQHQLNNHKNSDVDMVHQQLLRRVFQMCDVQRRGHISIDDLLELGQSYLGQHTKVHFFF